MEEGEWDCMTEEKLNDPSQLFKLCAMMLCDYILWNKKVHSRIIFKIDWIAWLHIFVIEYKRLTNTVLHEQ